MPFPVRPASPVRSPAWCLGALIVLGAAGTAGAATPAAAATEVGTVAASPWTAILRLRIGQALPASLGRQLELERLSDGVRIALPGGAVLADLPSGAYRVGSVLIEVRQDDSAAEQAAALIGLPVLGGLDADGYAAAARAGLGFSAASLPIACWSAADGWSWPWVAWTGYWGGLASLCWRHAPDGRPHAYAPALGCYVDHLGAALRIVDHLPSRAEEAIGLGDLIAGAGQSGILVEDRGRPGLLDPNDVVVTASPDPRAGPGSLGRVRRMRVGDLMGTAAIDCYSRDRALGARRVAALAGQQPLAHLSFRRQMLALAGMLVLCGLLVLRARRGLRRLRQGAVPSPLVGVGPGGRGRS